MLISLNDISVRSGDQISFEHTTWQIFSRQRWAVIGPNGSGKSILARAVAKKIPLAQGRIIYYFDKDHAPQGRSYLLANEVSILSAETHQDFLRQFADYHQARWQSFEGADSPRVSDLLALNGRPAGDPAAVTQIMNSYQQKRGDLLDLFNLADLMDRKVHQLSNGESRKVLLMRMLLHEPRLLILDEPFDGLDQDSRERLREAINRLMVAQDPPVLYVGARAEDLPENVTHVLLVRDHQVEAMGEKDAMLQRLAAYPASNPRPAVMDPFANSVLRGSMERFIRMDSEAKQGHSAQTASVTGGEEAPEPPEDPWDRSAFREMVAQYSSALAQSPFQGDAELVHMKDVNVTYQHVNVVDHLNWTVRRGERWALLGPNGAGKTTLLSLVLADNPQAYRNEIRLFGKPRGSGESIWQIKRRIGWVSPELHAFYDQAATCLDVVCSGYFDSVGLYREVDEAQQKIALGWLNALGLSDLKARRFHSLSAGQQRVALLARALVKFPPLLVLDEPCQGLDDQRRAVFVGLVEQICTQTPVTLIFVTHYLEELPPAVNHHLRIEKGSVVECC